jgi:hypothetical protein
MRFTGLKADQLLAESFLCRLFDCLCDTLPSRIVEPNQVNPNIYLRGLFAFCPLAPVVNCSRSFVASSPKGSGTGYVFGKPSGLKGVS